MPVEESDSPSRGGNKLGAALSKVPMILAVTNTLVVLGAAGMLYYAKVLYKRPAITEENERKRLETHKAHPENSRVSGQISFPPVTVNIEPQHGRKPGDAEGQMHYVTMGFAFELRDMSQKPVVDSVRPIFMDKILALVAQKPFHELSTVQGRYLLRTQILELVNQVTAPLASVRPETVQAKAAPAGDGHGEGSPPATGEHGAAPAEAEHGGPPPDGPPIRSQFADGLVSNVFFTQFIVQ